jgi:hypothetical protein
MMLECNTREDLMLEYIRAGNQLVDLKMRGGKRTLLPAHDLASILIKRALEQRTQARDNLLKHCGQHGC